MRRLRLAKEIASTRSNQFRNWPNVLVYDPALAADIREDSIPTDGVERSAAVAFQTSG